jgi:hypothetical protein
MVSNATLVFLFISLFRNYTIYLGLPLKDFPLGKQNEDKNSLIFSYGFELFQISVLVGSVIACYLHLRCFLYEQLNLKFNC